MFGVEEGPQGGQDYRTDVQVPDSGPALNCLQAVRVRSVNYHPDSLLVVTTLTVQVKH